MPKSGIRILEATVAVEASRAELLPRFPLKVEVPSLLTDFGLVRETGFFRQADGRISITDRTGRPRVRIGPRMAAFSGPFLRLEREASDLRYSLWGNQGFLYRFALRLLEERRRIYSFHAAGLYEESGNILYVVAGGAGSGKTVFLLDGISKGLKLFSTETVHFRISAGSVSWFKGSLVDNVRLGTLLHDFPSHLPSPVPRKERRDVWGVKVALDLGAYQAGPDILKNPAVVLLFPRVEEGRREFVLRPFRTPGAAAKPIFDNIAQKIGESVVLYDVLALPGQDTPALAAARWREANRLAGHSSLRLAAGVLCGTRDCWDGLFGRKFKAIRSST
jgi:hypothetical protein